MGVDFPVVSCVDVENGLSIGARTKARPNDGPLPSDITTAAACRLNQNGPGAMSRDRAIHQRPAISSARGGDSDYGFGAAWKVRAQGRR